MSSVALVEAARDGNVEVLDDLLKENPSVLAEFSLVSLQESLLHVAVKSGQCNFVHGLLKINRGIVQELDKDGFRPLDVAVIVGNLGIVKEVLSFDPNLCRLKGRDQRTALHYAAIKGRVDVIDTLLSACTDCVEDATVYGETALHLAMKNYQFDAFSSLVKGLVRLGKESIVNVGDGDGNTVLHLAISTRQFACVDLLIGEKRTVEGTIDVNAKNAEGLTPLDVLGTKDSSYNAKIHEILESAGAIAAPAGSKLLKKIKRKHGLQPVPSKNWFNYFKFQKQRDSPSDTRNALLVVAVLIATVCFEAGVNPPNGIRDRPPQANNATNPNIRQQPFAGPAEGSALAAALAALGSHASLLLFLFTNSLGITASSCIIIYLTSGFPFQRELHIALYSMMFTYSVASSAIVKDASTKKKAAAYLVVMIACALPVAQRWLPRWGKSAWKAWRNRDVRETPLPVSH